MNEDIVFNTADKVLLNNDGGAKQGKPAGQGKDLSRQGMGLEENMPLAEFQIEPVLVPV